jgi:hypothetical protein
MLHSAIGACSWKCQLHKHPLCHAQGSDLDPSQAPDSILEVLRAAVARATGHQGDKTAWRLDSCILVMMMERAENLPVIVLQVNLDSHPLTCAEICTKIIFD